MIVDPRYLIGAPVKITSEQRLVMARGDKILADAKIERQGGTEVVGRSGRGDHLYRFGVGLGCRSEAELAFAAQPLGEPFMVYERGAMKAL